MKKIKGLWPKKNEELFIALAFIQTIYLVVEKLSGGGQTSWLWINYMVVDKQSGGR